ncbi:hypothetical protein GA0061096_1353 [Fictibacillus enclensis]|uniref:Uncharacterized protein n=1 Tax=Fictibacillus enclensis TaxID=1017270 RepID=A0A0V8JE03_9BACL|nr:hypothetical protein [Fictibacillus enclensis]KSU85162.1 hypothetical protein AS030_06495 [Fictibacillus enclensis]SCB91968.1 hypothetical protein GA0061096_1353 [Fictibacillus enclensis]
MTLRAEHPDLYQAVDSLHEAYVEYSRTIDKLDDIGVQITSFEGVVEHIEKGITSLLPNGAPWFEEYIENFSTDDLFTIEKLAMEDKIESVGASSDGVKVILQNKEVAIHRPLEIINEA